MIFRSINGRGNHKLRGFVASKTHINFRFNGSAIMTAGVLDKYVSYLYVNYEEKTTPINRSFFGYRAERLYFRKSLDSGYLGGR